MLEVVKKIFRLIGRIMKEHTGTHASSIAFYFFMSLVPLMIIYAGFIPRSWIRPEEIISFFCQFVPETSHGIVETIVREAFSQSGAAFSVSLLVLLWTASRSIKALIDGLNAMYRETETRGFAKVTGISVISMAGVILFISGAVLLIFSGRILSLLRQVIPGIRIHGGMMIFINFLMLLFFGIFFFMLIYTYLPSGSRKFRDQFPGAFLASSFWFILSIAFRIYIQYFNGITRFYGSLAAVSLFLFWLYCLFIILLAGGYINRHYAEIVPADIDLFFVRERKKAFAAVALLFLGFLAYLSNCFLCWNPASTKSMHSLQMICKCVSQASWMTAVMICVKNIHGDYPRKDLVILLLMAVVDFAVLQVGYFRKVLIFLVIFTAWYLLTLLVCLKAVLSENGKYGPQGEKMSS